MNLENYYLVYHKINDYQYRIYCPVQDRCKIINYKEYLKIKQRRYYQMKIEKGLPEEALKEYYKLFEQWRLELLSEKIDVLKSSTLAFLTTDVYFSFCDIIKDMPTITPTEYAWFMKTNRSALMYFNEEYNEKPVMSYAYDYKNFYGKILSSRNFRIPKSRGYESSISELPAYNKIKCGIYNVIITCNHPIFNKTFLYSKNNCYSDVSLKHALANKEKYDISFEIPEGINCLLFDETITGDKLFKKHFDELSRIKNKYPNNKIVKHILSSLWGHLTQMNVKNITTEEFIDLDISHDINDNTEYIVLDHKSRYIKGEYDDYFTVAKRNKIYQYNIRLAPWLIPFGRNKIGNLAMESIDDVIRIQTDCVVFNKEMKFEKIHLDIKTIVEESKSSGFIKWKNVNVYSKQCEHCNEWVAVSKMKNHA